MARTTESNNTHLGSITVTVNVSGVGAGVMHNALVSLYKAPRRADCLNFEDKDWEATVEMVLIKTGRTDQNGKVPFPGLSPAIYNPLSVSERKWAWPSGKN